MLGGWVPGAGGEGTSMLGGWTGSSAGAWLGWAGSDGGGVGGEGDGSSGTCGCCCIAILSFACQRPLGGAGFPPHAGVPPARRGGC